MFPYSLQNIDQSSLSDRKLIKIKRGTSLSYEKDSDSGLAANPLTAADKFS